MSVNEGAMTVGRGGGVFEWEPNFSLENLSRCPKSIPKAKHKQTEFTQANL